MGLCLLHSAICRLQHFSDTLEADLLMTRALKYAMQILTRELQMLLPAQQQHSMLPTLCSMGR